MREYLSEEELEQLVNHLEQQPLYAPKHLKEQILEQAFPREAPSAFALFSYRLKMIAGMAAALAMLVLIPQQNRQERNQVFRWEIGQETEPGRERAGWEDWIKESGWQEEKENKVSMHAALRESGQKIQQSMNSWIEYLQ